LDAEDVIVRGEHVHGGRAVGGTHGDGNLRVVDAGEVARTGRLVFLGLEREGVGVHTGVWGAGVVVEGLHLVEVLTLLGLESILTVEDQLELGHGTDGIFRESGATTIRAEHEERGTVARGGDHTVRLETRNVGGENDIVVVRLGGEVPQGVLVGGDVREAPHKLLDGVVVREADLLGLGGIDGVGTSVLNLLDQVFVTLLGESASLFGVQVDVVGPHLEGVGVAVGGEIRRKVDVHTDFMVLKRDQRQVQPGVTVEEEEQGEVHGLAGDTSGHLTVRSLLGLIQVKLRVQPPPLLVVLVDALTTDGKLNVVDGALSNPASRGRGGGVGEEFDVHVTDEITVTGDSHRHATGTSGSTVDGLLDVFHREVGVALVFRLEEGYLRVTGKVDVLGTVSYELHETTGHFESCCTISREINSVQTRIY